MTPSATRELPGARESRYAYLARVRQRQEQLQSLKQHEARQMALLYPRVRTYDVVDVEAVGPAAEAAEAVAALPRVLTLVTPDHNDPAQDQLFIGPYPVLSKDYTYDVVEDRAQFVTEGRHGLLRGTLQFEVARSRAFGVVDYLGQALSIEIRVRPQRYVMSLGRDAAHLSGQSPWWSIEWDVNSTAWRGAKWTDEKQVAMTYGTKEYPSEMPGEDPVLEFYAAFDSEQHGTFWEPPRGTYGGELRPVGSGNNERDELLFSLTSDAPDPEASGHEWSWFPYQLRVHMEPFSDVFVGGMLTKDWSDPEDPKNVVFGVKGRWAGRHAGGLYYLYREDGSPDAAMVVGVHGGILYIDDRPVPSSRMAGTTLTWNYLPRALRNRGLPSAGKLEFSADGSRILTPPPGFTGGDRVTPDQAAEVVDSAGGTRVLTRTARARADRSKLSVTELMNMSSMVRDPDGSLKDRFQESVMSDLHKILLNYMDKDLREKFLMPNPPTLDPKVREISQIPGVDSDGRPINPAQWYWSQTDAFLCTALGENWPGAEAKKFNKARASRAMNEGFSKSSVVQRQSSALYANQFRKEFPRILDYLHDQDVNAASYVSSIRAKIDQLVAEVEEYANDHPEDVKNKDEMVSRLRNMGDRVISNRAYWSMSVFAHATSATTLNNYRTIVATSRDTSRIVQHVNGINALLAILDDTGDMAAEYTMVLSYFHITNLIPELANVADNPGLLGNLRALIQKFIDEYKGGKDTELAQIAAEMEQKLTQAALQDMVQMLISAARIAGTWTQFVTEAQSKIGAYAGGIFASLARMIIIGAAVMLIVQFTTGHLDWDSLDAPAKLGVVALGVRLLAQLASAVYSIGVQMTQLWGTKNALWSVAKALFTPASMAKVQASAAAAAQANLQATGSIQMTNFRQASTAAANAVDDVAVAAKNKSLLKSIFGKKFTRFLSMSLGVALAAVGVAVSAWLLATSDSTGLGLIANWLFVAASVLEFIAAVSAWGFGAAGVQSIAALGGLAVSTLCSVLSVLSVIALIAGIVLLIIYMTRPQEHPLESYAKSTRFYRPLGFDMEDFEIFTPDGVKSQLVGVSLSADGDRTRCVRMAADGTVTASGFDRTGHTGFLLYTDGEGRAQYYAVLPDKECRPQIAGLAVDKTGKLIASVRQPDGPTAEPFTDPKAMWRFEPIGNAVYADGKVNGSTASTSMLMSADFRLYNEWWYTQNKSKLFLVYRNGTWTTSTSSPTAIRVTMEAIGPQCLTMADISWGASEKNREQYPGLGMPGSGPRTFTLTPSLPSTLEFDSLTGRVAMKKDATMTPVAKKTYTLTVAGAQGGSAQARFSLEITK
jgi:hypothetical protein